MSAPRADEVTLTERPPRRSYRCGPGSLEMITVSTWTRRNIGWVRVHGHYDVYCGNGNEHRVAIDEKAWAIDFVPYDLDTTAHEMIALALDDWSDPCEDALSMPEPEEVGA
jgi:hypothetical protein